MERTNFENLQVYRLAENLADGIWDIVSAWDYFAKDTVGKQIVKAADSIGVTSLKEPAEVVLEDNRRFIKIARGSLYETQQWLRRAYKRQFQS
ncbi:MAG TPA: four helix bundle protein [Pyrinomonadaceae bacterium]|nr:four helix bundle protein [Pyrinomonadaceae bacterium]